MYRNLPYPSLRCFLRALFAEAVGHGMGPEFFRRSENNARKRAQLDGLSHGAAAE